MKSMFKETLDRLGREMRTKKLLNATKRGEAVDVSEEKEKKLFGDVVPTWGKNKEEPEPPKDYKELKVGDVVTVSGVQMTVRKLTKKDVILRPVKKTIRDEHGLMLSEKEEKAIIESAEGNSHGD